MRCLDSSKCLKQSNQNAIGCCVPIALLQITSGKQKWQLFFVLSMAVLSYCKMPIAARGTLQWFALSQ
jgi:hypothetical protein